MDQILIAVILLICLYMLGSSRLGGLINAVAWQGLFLCLLALVIQKGSMHLEHWVLIGLSVVIKAFVLPSLLKRALHETTVRRETEPLVGYSLSLFIGLICLIGSIWTAWHLPLPAKIDNPMAVAISLFTLLTGVLLIVTRTKEFMQRLLAKGVGSQVLYIPVYLQPWYREQYGYRRGKCPQAEKFYQQSLSLPLYYSMTDEDVTYVIDQILNVVKG